MGAAAARAHRWAAAEDMSFTPAAMQGAAAAFSSFFGGVGSSFCTETSRSCVPPASAAASLPTQRGSFDVLTPPTPGQTPPFRRPQRSFLTMMSHELRRDGGAGAWGSFLSGRLLTLPLDFLGYYSSCFFPPPLLRSLIHSPPIPALISLSHWLFFSRFQDSSQRYRCPDMVRRRPWPVVVAATSPDVAARPRLRRWRR